ncbi:hypothetical protein HG263_19030 [Pseudoalteromonas sp. JBTF-M23]|uniref:Uncharacterized protein n=1 Tax=Pseudoalteromonas caenipelagi TaxID=2726988 RepID=A0A849VLP4_9GAMM|nr:hypothetical protein [Pseudoalteromonas caenipelagi]NOU52601.1 hypothetical protein [Pseudoalteromonas caenipelagi]
MICIFSGEQADTKEHVVPAWLQRKMNLSNQKVNLPNGTCLKYKQVVVPATKEHNEKFAEIEGRIANGIYDPLEVYLWALKIHIGFIFRDSTLKSDIKNPESGFILEVGDYESEIRLFRKLYRIWSRGGTINPDSFGSVFIVDSLTQKNEFELVHCGISGAVGIDVGDKFILVMLWDLQKTLNSNVLNEWNNFHCKKLKMLEGRPEYNDHCIMTTRVWACETAYFAFRFLQPIRTVQVNDNLFASLDRSKKVPREINDFEFAAICKNFGLKRVHMPEMGDYVYTQFDEISS